MRTPDMPRADLCECLKFDLWYIDDDGPPLPVCKCGHPDTEHLDKTRSCTGFVEWT